MFKKSSEQQSEQGLEASTPPVTETTVEQEPLPQGGIKEHRRSVLSPSMSIKGDISGTEDLVVEGKMEGTISLPKNEVLIGADGQIKADVTALKVSIEGRVTGDIRGSERVVIKHSGRVEGNIVAPRVVLEDGCQFKGSVEMNTDASVSGTSMSSTAVDSRQKSNSGSGVQPGQYSGDSRQKSDSDSGVQPGQYSGVKTTASSA